MTLKASTACHHSTLSLFASFRADLTAGGNCPGCEAAREELERSIVNGRQLWTRHSDDNTNHQRISADPLLPGLAWPENSHEPVFLPTRVHSCDYSRPLSLVRTWFYPHHVLRLNDPAHSIIHFRLHFHLVIPGELNHKWNSSARFDATFPLFGALRRYWGRALRVRGTAFFMGERRSRTRRIVTDLSTIRVAAEVRRPGLLRMNRFSAQTHLQLGPRLDGMLLGVGLQWHSEVDDSRLPVEDVAVEPEAVSVDILCEPLRQYIHLNPSPRWSRWEQVREMRSREGGFFFSLGSGDEDGGGGENKDAEEEVGGNAREEGEEGRPEEEVGVPPCPSSPSEEGREEL